MNRLPTSGLQDVSTLWQIGSVAGRTLEQLTFDNTYARLSEAFYAKVNPTPFSEAPYLVGFNAAAGVR